MPNVTGSKVVPQVSHYAVVDNSVVTLQAEVGHGQPAGIAVALDGKSVAHGLSFPALALGAGQALRGRLLSVTATVIDNNPTTDQTSTVFRLTGGVGTRDLSKDATATPGEAVIYVFEVNLL